MVERSRFARLLFPFVAGALLCSCAPKTSSSMQGEAPRVAGRAEKSGVELWAQNCLRCHNIRPSNYLTAGEWEVAVRHMRLRANLTAEETRKISDFLRSSAAP